MGDDFICGLAAHALPAPGLPDVVWLNERDREILGQPPELLSVHTPDDEPTRVLDTTRPGADREALVIAWWPRSDAPIDSYPVIASDFGEYLLREVEFHLGMGARTDPD